jgi:hypothetical protein
MRMLLGNAVGIVRRELQRRVPRALITQADGNPVSEEIVGMQA